MPPPTLRFLNAAPRPPADGSGPFGARGVPTSVRRHGATTRRGADRTTRDAGRRAKTPTRTARGLVARREASRHTPTTPIETPITKIIAMSGGGVGNPGDYLELAHEFGASYTLAKPFTPELLLEMVGKALE